jgi:hypothetical protein
MAQDDKETVSQKQNPSPLIFISHDSRDAELAEAFSKLLRTVSAGMLKSFRSSDKRGREGIEFGDEWFKRLMEKLDAASDVVCLLTKRSLDRPWILFEAGVAKGKFGGSVQAKVQGIALGIPLKRVSESGPFYLFQNNDGSEDGLVKLVAQLCRRVQDLDPDEQIVRTQVVEFKKTVEEFLKRAESDTPDEDAEEVAGAKVVEEMKIIVRELSARMDDGGERYRNRRFRRFHPMMIQEMAHMISHSHDDPIGILIIASLVRDDMPWIYEIASEAYRATKAGRDRDAHEALRMLRNAIEFSFHGPFAEDLGKETFMALHEVPRMIEHQISRASKKKKGAGSTAKPPHKED